VKDFGGGKEREAEYGHLEDFPIFFFILERKSVKTEKGDP
jgi:hypothetical protein